MGEKIESGSSLEEKGFRLSQHEVGAWAESILCREGGDVRDPEVQSAEMILQKHLEPMRANSLTSRLIDETRLATIGQDMRDQTTAGLAELSEGLSYYGLVQAIVSTDGQNEVIDLAGIRADSKDIAVLVDREGREHRYGDFIGLLIPNEDGDE